MFNRRREEKSTADFEIKELKTCIALIKRVMLKNKKKKRKQYLVFGGVGIATIIAIGSLCLLTYRILELPVETQELWRNDALTKFVQPRINSISCAELYPDKYKDMLNGRKAKMCEIKSITDELSAALYLIISTLDYLLTDKECLSLTRLFCGSRPLLTYSMFTLLMFFWMGIMLAANEANTRLGKYFKTDPIKIEAYNLAKLKRVAKKHHIPFNEDNLRETLNKFELLVYKLTNDSSNFQSNSLWSVLPNGFR